MRGALRGVVVVCVLLSGGWQARAAAPLALAPNDSCFRPASLTDGASVDANTIVAVDDATARNGEGFVAPDLVYSFTLESLRQVTITSAGTPFIPVVYVRTTCDDASTEVAFDDLGQPVRFNAGPGTYYVFVDGDRGSYFDRGTFTLTYATSDPPVGDLCDSAVPIASRSAATGSTASLDADYRSGSVPSEGRDAVYTFTLDEPAHVHLDTAGSAFDTVLYVRSDCADASSELGADDDASAWTYSSALDLDLPAGTYFAFVDGYFFRASGAYTLRLAVTE